MKPSLVRRLAAEFLGSALLAALVIGSGIAAQRLSPDDTGLQLLENALATALGLPVLILVFAPVSGAHFNPVVSLGLHRVINKGSEAQAVFPVQEISVLFDLIVSPIQLALLIITVLICVVSGISILVSIYNSMSDRRHEIAVMRALGAGRSTVMTIILFESIMLSLAAGACGWVAAHAGIAAASPAFIEPTTGVAIGFFDFAPSINVLEVLKIDSTMERKLKVSPELLLVPGLMLLAILVGLLPAMTAYRTDVAKSLGV